MSRRSVQRRIWHSIFKGLEESSLGWLDWVAWILAVAFVVYMFIAM